MKKSRFSGPVYGTALLAVAFITGALPASATNTAMRFYGVVKHVSADNIKVYDPKTKQTVGFALTPHFHNVFKKSGSKTAQLSEIAPGQYVEVRYDRKALGIAHADRIDLLDQNNNIVTKQ